MPGLLHTDIILEHCPMLATFPQYLIILLQLRNDIYNKKCSNGDVDNQENDTNTNDSNEKMDNAIIVYLLK